MIKLSNPAHSARKARRFLLVAAVAAGAVVVPTSGAQAGTSCSSVFGCSESKNSSAQPATAWHDWTCSSGSTGTASTGCKGGTSYWLTPGAHTPSNQDWDVLQIDAGWCYKVNLVNWYGKNWNVTYNRIGQSTPEYVKIEDGSVATVLAQSLSSCP